MAPDLPCEDLDAGLEEYAELAEAALLGTTGDVIVVGHSLGALTASVVASRRPVRGLTFVAGIIGEPGRSLEDLAEVDRDRDIPLGREDHDTDDAGRFRFTPAGARRVLYHDCPYEVAQTAIGRLRFQRSLWRERLPFNEWPSCEITSIVCGNDRLVNPVWLRRVSVERLAAAPIELASGHSPFFSQPAQLAALLMTGLS